MALIGDLKAITGDLSFLNPSSPAQITADQIDYAIAANVTVLRLSSDAPRSIRSIAGGTAGRYLIVSNVGTSLLILPDEDLLGTAANRIATPGDIVLFPDQSVTLLYDGVSSRWRSPESFKQWKRKAIWAAPGNSTAITVLNATTWSLTGTATAANIALGTYSQYRKIEYLVTTAATTAVAGFRAPAAQFVRGNSANGGFNFNMRWGTATGMANTSNRAFVGLAASVAAPTDVQPSSLVDMIGMGWDSADTNVQIFHNDASGTATKIDLGANFPVRIVDRNDMFDLQLLCLPAASSMYWKAISLGAAASASGVITTNLPTNTTFLAPRGWMSAGGSSSVIGIGFSECTIESDY